MSRIRKTYMVRLVGRCAVLVICLLICLYAPGWLTVLDGSNFFTQLSPLHILWVIWVIDMLAQLVPIRKRISLGSLKMFREQFRPIREKINYDALREHVLSTTRAAYRVMLLWLGLLTVIGVLYYTKVINKVALFMISVTFYMADLICVLFWCPFRLIMKNRCCTTCRIFNWDHLMMFTPMMFCTGFYSRSLLFMALLTWCVWELCILIYPERFWEHANSALKCSQCTDKLCTQYCQKLRT